MASLVIGLLRAAIRATMITISSQRLVASAFLTEDFYALSARRAAPQEGPVLVGRLAVLAVALTIVLYEMVPGFIVSALAIVAVSLMGKARQVRSPPPSTRSRRS